MGSRRYKTTRHVRSPPMFSLAYSGGTSVATNARWGSANKAAKAALGGFACDGRPRAGVRPCAKGVVPVGAPGRLEARGGGKTVLVHVGCFQQRADFLTRRDHL